MCLRVGRGAPAPRRRSAHMGACTCGKNLKTTSRNLSRILRARALHRGIRPEQYQVFLPLLRRASVKESKLRVKSTAEKISSLMAYCRGKSVLPKAQSRWGKMDK